MSKPENLEIYLHPGEWKLVRAPAIVKTVLGSCVGITFRASRLEIGAMCHPMLPHRDPQSPLSRDTGAPGRYVDSIIRELAADLDDLGAVRSEIEVKVFGGADVLATTRKATSVGKLNADVAVRVLEEEGFRLAASRLGGSRGVFIEFHTDSGEVLLRPLNQMDAATVAQI